MTIKELSKIRKILIIRLSSLGDILLTTPLIRSLKNQFPSIQIDMIIREEYKDAIKLNPYISEKYFFQQNKNSNDELIKVLAANSYNLILDLQNNLRSKRIVSSLKFESLKFNKNSFKKFLLVNFKINRLQHEPQIPVRYANTIPDFKLDENGLDLFSDRKPSAQLENSNNIVALCPGARHFTKCWPKEYIIELGNSLVKAGFNVAIMGGKIDKIICSEISNKITGSINLSNDDDLLQTTADFNICKLVVCNDSGLMHVASATKTKVLAIFGSTVKEFGFAPYNCTNLILENDSLTCRPCSHIGRSDCPKKHFNCMNSIKPEFVLNRILSFITNE